MARDWSALVDGMTDVQKLVHLVMRYDAVNEEAVRAQLLKARRKEYEATLTEMAAAAGCDNRAILGEGDILSELNDLSSADAKSIANTYNYEVGIAIIAIATETPTANRNTYAKRLRTWEENRGKHKDAQIAMNTNLTARTLAQRDFARFNRNATGQAELRGGPAAEPICQGWLNRGRVPLQTAINNPSPFHMNCPHYWHFLPAEQLSDDECADLWMGR